MGVLADEDITPLLVVSVPFLGGIAALGMTALLLGRVRSAKAGAGRHVAVAEQIAEGATSFLTLETKLVAPLVAFLAVCVVGMLQGQNEAPNAKTTHRGGWQAMICVFCGAATSAAAAWASAKIASEANVKAAEAARDSAAASLEVAFAGATVVGFYFVSFALLALSFLFYVFAVAQEGSGIYDIFDAVRYLTGFVLGASVFSSCARVANGVYAKAADVGADLLGKIEGKIDGDLFKTDDPRANPATTMDNVGGIVAEVAGSGADIFESLVAAIIACASLAETTREVCLPFWLAGFGVIAAALGFW